MKKYNVVVNDTTNITVDSGWTFNDLINTYFKEKKLEVALCKFNNKYYELDSEIPGAGAIEFTPYTKDEGVRVYSRTLQFIFIKATLDIFKDAEIVIEHSIGKGLFGEINKNSPLNEEDLEKIKARMEELINKDLEISKIKVRKEDAIRIFKSYGMKDKVTLLEQMDFEVVNLYKLQDRYDYFYGYMAGRTGIIKGFDLMLYKSGFILRHPDENSLKIIGEFKKQEKLANIFIETQRWLKILDVGGVGALNKEIRSNNFLKLMMTAEALHEKKIAEIADKINSKKETKLVLIAGPSSSGKTTFARRLGIQLRVNGLKPIAISLDDYFVDRDKNPVDENGELDFETIDSVDTKLFNEQLNQILKGKEVEIPTFNFITGKREWCGEKIKLPDKGILIIEGIHGLNPILTSEIEEKYKFKIYISALTQLNLDNHNRISTTDVRRVRRIVRDTLSRGHSAEETLKMWPKIKRGEKKNIFIFQEEADIMFNSTLVHELCVLKKYAIKELEKINHDSIVYNEAKRLKAFLGFFDEMDSDIIPENSILREFIGGSIFYKY